MRPSIFDLQRLEKGSKLFTFPSPDGGEVEITAHYPTSYELAAALYYAKADIEHAQKLAADNEGREGASLEVIGMTAKMGVAIEQLACYCIDTCSALPIEKIKDATGIRRISHANEEALAPVLSLIGSSLYRGAEVSKEEKEG